MTNGLDPVLVWTLRLALALLFGAAARHKLRDPAAFVQTLRGYRVMPAFVVPVASGAVIVAEVLLAGGFLMSAAAPIAASGAIGLFALYSAAIGWNLARGRRDIDCGCLGPGRRQLLHPWLIARNLVLATASMALLAGSAARPWVWVDIFTLVAGVVTVCLMWSALNSLGASTNRAGIIA